jgi:hypothetical protein
MFFNIPNNRDDNLFIFPGSRSSGTNEWKAWTIPSSANYISMIAIGPGGNGGLGRAIANGTGKGGGGGGASGAVSKVVYATKFLPSVIYYNLSTTETTISVEPSSTNSLYVKLLFALAGGAGGTATGTTGGAAGTAPVAATDVSVGPPPFLGSALLYSCIAGQAGAAGGAAGVAGTNIVILNPTTTIVTGGAGGGGTAVTPGYTAGGSVTSGFGYFPTIDGGALNAAGKGGDGAEGTWLWNPHPMGLGGAGGGAGSTLPGVGGDGGFGCGGGGGGSCVTADANAFGIGGPGLIIIKCW